MRAAPYSYDLLDNCGRQSPQTLTPGLDQLEIGQDLMGIFNLVDFTQNVHVTMRVRPNTRASRLFGDIAGSYLIEPNRGSCRLLVKLIVRYPRSLLSRLMRKVLPWGDLIMMRRQLLNFKRLAEGTGELGNSGTGEPVNRGK